MELYESILYNAIARDVIPSLQLDRDKLAELKCYQTIEKIYQIVSDETLEDPECFRKIEEIVCAFEELGIGGGGRHDY